MIVAIPTMPDTPLPVRRVGIEAAPPPVPPVDDVTTSREFVEKNWEAFVWRTNAKGCFVWTEDIAILLDLKYHVAGRLTNRKVNRLMKDVYGVRPCQIWEMRDDGSVRKRPKWGFHGFTMQAADEPSSYFGR